MGVTAICAHGLGTGNMEQVVPNLFQEEGIPECGLKRGAHMAYGPVTWAGSAKPELSGRLSSVKFGEKSVHGLRSGNVEWSSEHIPRCRQPGFSFGAMCKIWLGGPVTQCREFQNVPRCRTHERALKRGAGNVWSPVTWVPNLTQVAGSLG